MEETDSPSAIWNLKLTQVNCCFFSSSIFNLRVYKPYAYQKKTSFNVRHVTKCAYHLEKHIAQVMKKLVHWDGNSDNPMKIPSSQVNCKFTTIATPVAFNFISTPGNRCHSTSLYTPTKLDRNFPGRDNLDQPIQKYPKAILTIFEF